MAPLSLKIKVPKEDDALEVEIEDDETIEALCVVVYSVKPDLGEDFKLLKSGKILKQDAVLSAIGIKNGDQLLLAKTAAKTTIVSETPPLESTSPSAAKATFDPPPRLPGDEHPAYSNGEISRSPPSKCPRLDEGSMDVEAPLEKAQIEQLPASGEIVQESPVQPSINSVSHELVEPSAKLEASASEDLPPSTTQQDKPIAAISETNEQQQSEQPATPEPIPIQVDATSAGLTAFATSLENGGPVPSPAQLAGIMRDSASRMRVLEEAVKEFSQALQMVNVISATGLRGGMGELGIDTSPKSQQEEGGRSFLIKKGDADLQELHQKAASATPMARTTSGTTGGGALSTSSVPLTKEEMDKARQARLAKLEAMQQEKAKEKAEADEKSRARDAMFSRRSDPPGRPLGKH
jgi:hypothetical protein